MRTKGKVITCFSRAQGSATFFQNLNYINSLSGLRCGPAWRLLACLLAYTLFFFFVYKNVVFPAQAE